MLFILSQGCFILEISCDPRMFYSLNDSVSVRNSSTKQSYDKGLCHWTNIIYLKVLLQCLFQWCFTNSLNICFLSISTLIKRMFSRKHLKHNNAQSPHIDSFTIPLPCSLLRGHIENSSHYFIDVILAMKNVWMDFCWKSKICNLCGIILIIFLINEYILWLQVSMNKVLFMN